MYPGNIKRQKAVLFTCNFVFKGISLYRKWEACNMKAIYNKPDRDINHEQQVKGDESKVGQVFPRGREKVKERDYKRVESGEKRRATCRSWVAVALCSGFFTKHCDTKSLKGSAHWSGFLNVGGGLVGIIKMAWEEKDNSHDVSGSLSTQIKSNQNSLNSTEQLNNFGQPRLSVKMLNI